MSTLLKKSLEAGEDEVPRLLRYPSPRRRAPGEDRPAPVRQLNRTIILQLLREHGPLSGYDVAKRTGLSRTAAYNVMDELVAAGLVQERLGRSRGGRRPVLYQLRAEAGFVIGVDFGWHPDSGGSLLPPGGIGRCLRGACDRWRRGERSGKRRGGSDQRGRPPARTRAGSGGGRSWSGGRRGGEGPAGGPSGLVRSPPRPDVERPVRVARHRRERHQCGGPGRDPFRRRAGPPACGLRPGGHGDRGGAGARWPALPGRVGRGG